MKDLFLLGVQWCGKGTQAKVLLNHFKWEFEYLEMGQLFRANMSNDNIVWKYCCDMVNSGCLAPSFICFDWYDIALKIAQEKNTALLTDWFPRSMDQAKFVEEMMKKYDRDFVIINYELSHDKAIERVMKRAKLEGRIDDIWESIKVRFDVFEDETLPAIKYFQEKGKVITINANDTIENVLNNTVKSLKENNYI